MDLRRQFIVENAKDTTFLYYIFSDLKKDDRVIFLGNWCHEPKNRILRLLKRIHYSTRINNIVNLPLKWIWKNIYTLEDIEWRKDVQYYLISSHLYPLDVHYLKKKQCAYPIKFILYCMDAWDDDKNTRRNKYYHAKLPFDMIFTINKEDEEKYHFIYLPAHYSMIEDNISPEIEYDLYFIGDNKGRLQQLLNVFEALRAQGISMHYTIYGVPRQERKYPDEIAYGDGAWLPYPEVVKGLKKANCILEVMFGLQQNSPTLRYFEAVCYNKKLLTNNKNVVNLPFYNPDYMHVFDKPEDIDWEWVKRRDSVDYHYDGRFSPTHLIDRIIELEEAHTVQTTPAVHRSGGGLICSTAACTFGWSFGGAAA